MTNEKELTHVDLFSGIGGFTLAAEWAGFKTVVFCEKEKFCQNILKKRFRAITYPDKGRYAQGLREEVSRRKSKTISNSEFSSRDSRGSSIFRPLLIPEIRDFDGTKYRGATLLTGGFPCQPFSVAGQRRGKEDDRYLWPEMRRVINEAKPRWILAENVPGIFRMALDTVLADLEGEGYTTGTFIIPACGLNAPHRRNRVWIVAHYGISQSMELSGSEQKRRDRISNGHQNVADSEAKQNDPRKRRDMAEAERSGRGSNSSAITGNQYAPDSDRFNGNDAGFGSGKIPQQKKTKIQRSNNSYAPDPPGQGLQGKKRGEKERIRHRFERQNSHTPDSEIPECKQSRQARRGRKRFTDRDKHAPDSRWSGLQVGEMFRQNIRQECPPLIRNIWQEDWYEVAARFCRVDDGISDRIHQLKALGNAIVPQVAYEILKNIAWIEKELHGN